MFRQVLFITIILLVNFTAFGGTYQEAVDFYGKKDWSNAQIHFEKHLKTTPSDPQANYNLGLCLLNQENFLEASWYFEKCFKLDPSISECKIQLDKCYQKLNLIDSWSPPLSFFELKLFKFPLQIWQFALILNSFLVAILLFIFISKKNSKKTVLPFLIFIGLFFLINCFYFNKRLNFTQNPTHGIIQLPIENVYLSEKGNALKNLTFHLGQRVRISNISERIRVELENGEHVFLDNSQVKVIQ